MNITSEYVCQTTVVMIMFNRFEETKRTFSAIREVKPKKLILISDGPRENVTSDFNAIIECRNLEYEVDWECEIIKDFSPINLGCQRRIVTGLSKVFETEDRAIILEDDCLPNLKFFKFMEWGLSEFKDDTNIGMISGSNLISHKFSISEYNGFSNYINIWGWATWKRVWLSHNPLLSIKEVKSNLKLHTSHLLFKWWETLYWKELFKNTLYAGTTWDFQLQYTFFKHKYLSVYPNENLIFNIGFSGNGTHTNKGTPDYIKLTKPNNFNDSIQLNKNKNKNTSRLRDKLLLNEIWSKNFFSTIRLFLMNILRLNF